MRLRTEASLGLGALLSVQILLVMLTIALLTRMGPAIERILEENVYSSEAVEDMLASLASSPPGPVPAEFSMALARARRNITEDAEAPTLATIEGHAVEAFQGNRGARAEMVEALRSLGRINRSSMTEADHRAQSLGQSGAWGAAILGALTLGLVVVIFRRMRLRLEVPLEAVRQTAHRVRAGNLQARVPRIRGAVELETLAQDFNWMLDQGLGAGPRTAVASDDPRADDIRRLLSWLLDRSGEAVMVLDGQGRRVAASDAAIGLKTPDLDDPHCRWRADEVPGTDLTVLREEAS